MPVPLRRWALALLAVLALVSPSLMTLWVWTPSGQDVQQRVKSSTDHHGVILLEPDQVPGLLAEAVVATEDERFYLHHGIDSIGLGRALLYDATNACFCEGGSTITEQLVKDIYLNGSDRGYNKIEDMVLALKVERVLSKSEIMADYLSEIATGQNRYGVSAAACSYFDSPLSSLSLGEYALLAGVTQAPSIYDPTVNPDAAQIRRGEVLASMLADHLITGAQAAEASSEPVLIRGSKPAAC
jgi:penicillin-binding protein 1A